MKHLLRDRYIALLDRGGWIARYRTRMESSGPLVRILVFHDVPDRAWFAHTLDMLRSRYHLLTPTAFHAREFRNDRTNVLLTFDDGYATWEVHVLPELVRCGVTGLFFLNSGLLDRAHDDRAVHEYMETQLRISPKRPLSWEGAHALRAAGNVFGGHTITHYDLTTLDAGERDQEIRADKERIEAVLGGALIDFAYPFGTVRHIDDGSVMSSADAGYRYSYTAESGFVQENDIVKGQIPRLCVETGQQEASLIRWIEGGYDLFVRTKKAWSR